MELLITGRIEYLNEGFLKKLKQNHKIILASDDVHKESFDKDTIVFEVELNDKNFDKIFQSYSIDTILYFTQRPENGSEYYNELSDLQNTLRYAYQHDINNVVYVTSSSIFAGQEADALKTGVQPLNGTGVVLQACEQLCDFYRRKYNMSVLILRTPCLYSEGETRGLAGRMIKTASETKRLKFPGPQNQECEFLAQSDLAELIVRILDNWSEQATCMNLPGSGGVQFGQLGTVLQAYLSGLEIEYNQNFALIARPYSDDSARREYDWLPVHNFIEEIPYLLEHIDDGQAIRGKWYEKFLRHIRNYRFIIKAAELLLGFGVMEYLNYLSGVSVYFEMVDFRMLYVLLLGTTHGLRTGLSAALLACASIVISYIRLGTDWRIIVYNIENWLPFACYMLIGAITGFIKDKKDAQIEFDHKEYRILEDRYVFLNELYMRALENKGQFKNQIMSYRDSFGRLFEVVKRLDSTVPDAVFKEAIIAMEDILENQSICIYTVDKRAKFGRLMVCSKEIREHTTKSIALEQYTLMLEALVPGEVWSNVERLLGYPEYAAPVYEHDQLVALVIIQTAKFEQLAMYYENLVKVMCGLMEASLLRAIEYSHMQDSKKYIPGTSILNKASFREILNVRRDMEEAAVSEFSLLKLPAAKSEQAKLADKALSVLRATDVIGIGEDDQLYIILSQTNEETIMYVLRRLESSNITYEHILQKAKV